MSKKVTFERVRKKFDARTTKIKEEYERKSKELGAKIERLKKERDCRLINAEKQLLKDSCLYFKRTLGQEDYSWLNAWLTRNKEKEIEEAENSHRTKHASELKEMSVEDYLFYYFNKPNIEGRLKKEMKQNKSEEAKRLSFILAKLKLEYLRVDRTLI